MRKEITKSKNYIKAGHLVGKEKVGGCCVESCEKVR